MKNGLEWLVLVERFKGPNHGDRVRGAGKPGDLPAHAEASQEGGREAAHDGPQEDRADLRGAAFLLEV